jgi:hypothetical protein
VVGIIALLSGCMPIHHQVRGWPQDLRVTVHTIPEEQIAGRCFVAPENPLDVLLLQLPIACAWMDLNRHTCDVYVTPTTPRSTLEHELEHCRGGDHGGRLQRYYDAWRHG